MLKLTKLDTKRLKLSFATFEDTVQYLTFVHPLFMASCSRMNSPINQTNRFLMVSFLILLRLLRVNILKQYYSPLSLSQYCWIIPSTSSWGLFNNINFTFGEQLLNIQNKIALIINYNSYWYRIEKMHVNNLHCILINPVNPVSQTLVKFVLSLNQRHNLVPRFSSTVGKRT